MSVHPYRRTPIYRNTILVALAGFAALLSPCRGLTAYDFGNPTAEEQLYVELINRARANPVDEGARLAATTNNDVLNAYKYFNVDLTMMQSEFSVLPALPPLAPNASLSTSARSHSAWMLATGTQSHDETNPANTPFSRMTAAGYSYTSASENIYASAKGTWYGHAGFQVDWGTGTGGMQSPRGHRANIYSVSNREVGVGLAFGTNGAAGPQIVTQDFGTSTTNPTLGTGVAYYDLNSNNFYDPGEGISGLTVNVSGAGFYCTTATGGGWVVPVPTNAAIRTVTFSGLNMNQSVSLVVPAATNAKADLMLTYAPPVITSTANAAAGVTHTLTFNPVGGASAYKWNRWTTTAAATENCDSTSNITTVTTGTYSVLNTTVKQQGSAAFHLENSVAPGASQSIQLNALYYGQSAPSLSFQSCVRYATIAEQCKVQIKEEGCTTWQDVFSQTGTNGSGEVGFTLRTATLNSMVGKAFRVRFLLSYTAGGAYFGGYSGDLMGWFIDAIGFSGVANLGNNVSQTLAVACGSFTPTTGSYLMSVAPIISDREFPASYQTLTAAVMIAPAITSHPVSATINSGGATTLSATASGTAPTFQWYAGASGVMTNPVAGATSATFTTPALTTTTCYWAQATNAAGSANSNAATITVISPPAITSQPVSITINSGGTATLSVVVSGTTPTFQWYAGASGTTTNLLTGATNSTFITPTLTTTTCYWVRATNAAGTANSTTATVTVSTPFGAWAANLEAANGLAAGTLANHPDDDYDHDGLSNLIEYAFGSSPVISDDPGTNLPLAQASPTHFILQYQRDTSLSDLTFTAQACADLTNWKKPGEAGAPIGFTDTVVDTTGTIETHQATIPHSSGSNFFIRVRVSRP